MESYWVVNDKTYKYSYGKWYVKVEVPFGSITLTRWVDSLSPF